MAEKDHRVPVEAADPRSAGRTTSAETERQGGEERGEGFGARWWAGGSLFPFPKIERDNVFLGRTGELSGSAFLWVASRNGPTMVTVDRKLFSLG